ncbi:MAG: dTDP-4-dehydrorhamnose reductase [Desulfovibrionaceae bacterium]|nr:dTDP-4-dehydrorhamnose reductase [Desulfovibrionaceae bacterium]
MKRILVLGGATGLLGQALVEKIKEQGYLVQSLGRKDGNLFEPSFLSQSLQEIAPDLIFNTVAWTQVDAAEDHKSEAKSVNAGFPETLAKLLSPTHCHLVHFSTDFVFGEVASKTLTEDTPPNPQCVYGSTKLEGEQILLKLIPNQVTICRTAWLFGPHRKNFIETICKAAKKQGQLKVVADQIGSPTYTRDLADWSLNLGLKQKVGIWHTVNSGQASWYELAAWALKLAGIEAQVVAIKSEDWPQKAKRPSFSALDCQKLSSFLGTKPRAWQEAVELYIQEVKF